MALSDLIARLEQDAGSRVASIRAQADAEVMAIDAGADLAMAERAAERLGRRRAERRAVLQRELAAARQQARARELNARHALLRRILDRARALLPEAAASPRYLRALPAHVDEALSYLQGLRPRVRCQPAFAPLLQPIVNAHDGAELVVDEATGAGVVAEAADGSVAVDNTLAGRLARLEARLAVELLSDVAHGPR